MLLLWFLCLWVFCLFALIFSLIAPQYCIASLYNKTQSLGAEGSQTQVCCTIKILFSAVKLPHWSVVFNRMHDCALMRPFFLYMTALKNSCKS